ncbi:hypothetical protein MUK42_34939, partial [Musa troglodytarum]
RLQVILRLDQTTKHKKGLPLVAICSYDVITKYPMRARRIDGSPRASDSSPNPIGGLLRNTAYDPIFCGTFGWSFFRTPQSDLLANGTIYGVSGFFLL